MAWEGKRWKRGKEEIVEGVSQQGKAVSDQLLEDSQNSGTNAPQIVLLL